MSEEIRVFHVDDEEDVCEVIEALLEGRGCQVETFNSGEDLLQALKTQEVDVVLSDYKMPGMTGLDVLRAVREFDPQLSVIFLSGMLTDDICSEAAELGIFDLLNKPTPTEDLHKALERGAAATKEARSKKAS